MTLEISHDTINSLNIEKMEDKQSALIHKSIMLSSQSIKEQMGCNAFLKVKLLIV